ncbi:MAG: hypothetical protein COV52_04830 [Gammaproteobacteria bacterium CG11_big_fil_rev_8_21_14_0_20_46_22]|nr:MAG: hypothetical protein COW05_02915 [Gammaproteobacteria bacterium CG12_big_fil_rev_8_21_14_0_65_46_12]PIR11277.1 MAG: hypothetical protein COV52_04830 [Gammaproteobacteria bacterium CG11_big_fil_rev_8_21_14_0_20_46_22]
MSKDQGEQGASLRQYTVSSASEAVCCPPKDCRVWDAHPRVFLELDEHGRAECPYCSAIFQLATS